LRIAKVLQAKRERGEKSFVAYLTAGDPDLKTTGRLVHALVRAGADVIELGVPHSDPVADGPTNLSAADRALRQGTTVTGILELVAELRSQRVEIPILLFTYCNPLLQFGYRRFAERGKQVGLDGALVVDLPPEEAGEYRQIMQEAGLGTVFLASPTTTVRRLALVNEASTAFVYYVSRAGVTGAQKVISRSLREELAMVRSQVSRPVCVGFGLSTPAQVAEVAPWADGVIVGSALVNLVQSCRSSEMAEEKLESFAREMVNALAKQEG